jgi:DNA-binding transcriptional MerR regulator
MQQPLTAIPDKLYFKIGEVCEITGVQPHVLRYWETEFPQLAPEKNRSGQRVYKRRDIEIVLKIKKLLYEEKFTIAGAKRRLAAETRFKVVSAETSPDTLETFPSGDTESRPRSLEALGQIRRGLEEVLAMLRDNDIITSRTKR